MSVEQNSFDPSDPRDVLARLEAAQADSVFVSWFQSYPRGGHPPRAFSSVEFVQFYDAWCAGKRIGVLEGKS